MKFILVSPLELEDRENIIDSKFPLSNYSDNFIDRQTENAHITKPKGTYLSTKKKIKCSEFPETFNIESSLLYTQAGREFVVLIIDFYNPERVLSTREGVINFEKSTHELIREVIKSSAETANLLDREVKWVNRTLVTDNEKLAAEISDHWFQRSGNKTYVPVGEGRFKMRFEWGNSALETNGNDIPEKLLEALVFTQFIWCNMEVIDRQSRKILEEAHPQAIERSDELYRSTIRLNYDLAVHSIFYERIISEGGTYSKDIVTQLLSAWDYDKVASNIEVRLGRIEHILDVRSELLRRSFEDKRQRASSAMEKILFFITLTTVISVALTFIQTAFSGEVKGMPTGLAMEWIRSHSNTDTWILMSTLASIFGAIWIWAKYIRK